MSSMLLKAKQAWMVDIRRRMKHTNGAGDQCDGVHQKDCSLVELYKLALDDMPVILVCWTCGHEAGVVDVTRAMEYAAEALADELRNVMRVVNGLRIKGQADAVVDFFQKAEQEDIDVDPKTLVRAMEQVTKRQAYFTSKIAAIVIPQGH